MRKENLPIEELSPDVLTKPEFSSLKKAEKNLNTDNLFLALVEAVRNGEAWVEITSGDRPGTKSAIIRQGSEMVFSTQDQGEVEVLELIKKGENVIIDHPSK